MALQHAAPGDRIELRRGDDDIAFFTPVALAKTEHMELIRMVLPKGKTVPEHSVEGEMTLVCLEGTLTVEAYGKKTALRPSQMMYLGGCQPYALSAEEDDVVALMTILLRKSPGD